jgi:hypothetical protein
VFRIITPTKLFLLLAYCCWGPQAPRI